MYNEQLQVLKRIKLELKFCSDCTNELNTQIDLCHSIMHTKRSGKLSKGLHAQINDMESDVKPVDSLFLKQINLLCSLLNQHVPISRLRNVYNHLRKRTISALYARKSSWTNVLSQTTLNITLEPLFHVKSAPHIVSVHLSCSRITCSFTRGVMCTLFVQFAKNNLNLHHN